MGPDVRLIHHRQSFTGVLVRIWCLVGDTFWTPWSQQFHIIPFSLAWIWLKTVDGLIWLKCKNSASVSVHRGSVKFAQMPTWKGFSPVWTSWWRLSLELSTNALPHSAQTCTRGPWVWRCFLMAELSLNIFVQPWGAEKVQHRVDKQYRQVNNAYLKSFLFLRTQIWNVKCPEHFFF